MADRGVAIRRFDGLTVQQLSVRCGLATGGGPWRRRRVAGGARPPPGARDSLEALTRRITAELTGCPTPQGTLVSYREGWSLVRDEGAG
jgi:hypothetical protein